MKKLAMGALGGGEAGAKGKKSGSSAAGSKISVDAQQQVQAYEQYVTLITTLHKECAEPVDWEQLRCAPSPLTDGVGENEVAAREKLQEEKPGFFSRVFGKGDEKKKEQEAEIEKAKALDKENYERWQLAQELSERILKKDVDAFLEALSVDNPFEDLTDFGGDFEFGTDNASYMEIEFKVNDEDIVPSVEKTLTKTGKLSEKALSKTRYYAMVQDYVCSCSIRLAREVFALLPVECVLVHAVQSRVNTATGLDDEMTVLSVVFERKTFDRVRFDRIDASDFVEQCEHYMSFQKTTGFKAVDRVILL